jgi:hypothetical protein
MASGNLASLPTEKSTRLQPSIFIVCFTPGYLASVSPCCCCCPGPLHDGHIVHGWSKARITRGIRCSEVCVRCAKAVCVCVCVCLCVCLCVCVCVCVCVCMCVCCQIVAQLLDVKVQCRKPSYDMAPDQGLMLYACEFADLPLYRSSCTCTPWLRWLLCHLDYSLVPRAAPAVLVVTVSLDIL